MSKDITKSNQGSAKYIKRSKKSVSYPAAGNAYICSTFNNNIITITDVQGNALQWSSAGVHGFKGPRKSTAYAAQFTAQHVGKIAYERGMKNIHVIISGSGSVAGEAAVKALYSAGLSVLSIRYKAAIPHNGCRPPKRPRV